MTEKPITDYDEEVKSTAFPDADHSFKMKYPMILEKLRNKTETEETASAEADNEYLTKLY